MLKQTDRDIIRHLAAEVAEIAALPVREEQFGFAWNDHQRVRLKLCAESAQGALLDLPVDQGEQDSPIASIGGTSS